VKAPLGRYALLVLLAALLVFAVASLTLSSRAGDDDDTDFYRDSWDVLGVDAGFEP
jgi:hypothetical protein